ncbi:MAG: 4-hydroxy-tetrahydrodipicolinate reductase [Actinobacteria bacterium]|uniref:4-hydroxy-tetrahydrodipicolinate reductase n=1 Tax=freshwater metagenome TaxID=449393 RepID=A0A6J6HXK5_9ZZZZ|nr:4-hydroxy-tetrahydrodipicolinate reductase [Actinomycetota bacterium]
MTIKVAVVGATGRMGKLALDLIDSAQDLSLHASLHSRSSLSELQGADVVFDVTKLEVSEQVVSYCIANGLPVVVGTSGWSSAKLSQIEAAVTKADSTAVIVPNFSIGSMLATRFAVEAAKHFSSIEIVEAHHANKVDSPSGTAIRTAELIAEARGVSPLITGVGQAARGEIVAGIPIHSIRLSGVSAKQEVILGGESEVLTIAHEVSSVVSYSAGILAAIRFAAGNKGLFVGLDAVIA